MGASGITQMKNESTTKPKLMRHRASGNASPLANQNLVQSLLSCATLSMSIELQIGWLDIVFQDKWVHLFGWFI